jgi:hypothetical protein
LSLSDPIVIENAMISIENESPNASVPFIELRVGFLSLPLIYAIAINPFYAIVETAELLQFLFVSCRLDAFRII